RVRWADHHLRRVLHHHQIGGSGAPTNGARQQGESMKADRVILAAESLAPGNGGVSRVARLMARVLGEEASAGRCAPRGLVLTDRTPPRPFPFPTTVARGSRLRFVYQVQKAALSHSHFLYDFLG